MSKFRQAMKSVKISCSHHDEFDIHCSSCFKALHNYAMSFGGFYSEVSQSINRFLDWASTLDEVEWRPFMNPGVWNNHNDKHERGLTKEVYEERKSLHEAFLRQTKG